MLRLPIFAASILSATCVAQVTGSFSMEKTVFAPGEPVFLNLTLLNQGAEPEEVITADPYSFCSGYRIEISRQGAPHVACHPASLSGSCMSGAITLAPHSSHTERILLNYPNHSQGDLNPPVRLPGDYTVDALRSIGYAPPSANSQLFASPNRTEVHGQFSMSVDRTLETPPSVYEPALQELASKDVAVKREAARTLATFAPLTLEPLLLTFATSKDVSLQEFAPLALANLNTEKSLSALAELLAHSDGGTYVSVSAADYLARTHDPRWLPALLRAADRNGGWYLSYAAQSGGELAIPALLERLHDSRSDVRGSAVTALGSTGSRAAIPLLVSLLRDAPGPGTDSFATAAAFALQQLTHFYLEPSSDEDRASQAQRWQHWWLTTGQNAKTYLPGDCVADSPLP